MNKLIVEYDPDDGITFPDNKAKEYVKKIIKDFTKSTKLLIPLHVVIGNELLITLFRCAVVKKKIKNTEIEFLFKGKTIEIDKCGMCKEWPKGFGDTDIEATEILLTYQLKEATKNHKKLLKK